MKWSENYPLTAKFLKKLIRQVKVQIKMSLSGDQSCFVSYKIYRRNYRSWTGENEQEKESEKQSEETIVVDRTTQRLRKLAALQGFVTEAQIEEVASTPQERERVQQILSRENITINAFVKEKEPLYERRTRRLIAARRQPRYTDPTWVYLNSVGRVPLLSRGQETEYAMQMEYAQGKLFNMTFRDQKSLESLYRIADELKHDELECIDVLQIDEEQLGKEEDFENLKKEFLRIVSLIKRKVTAINSSESEISEGDPKGELKAKIEQYLDDVVSLCRQLNLNSKQIELILENSNLHCCLKIKKNSSMNWALEACAIRLNVLLLKPMYVWLSVSLKICAAWNGNYRPIQEEIAD